jgi:hypothetical protein
VSEFTYLFHRTKTVSASPEDTQRRIQTWLAWFQELTDKGYLKDRGNYLEQGRGNLVVGKKKSVTDGPFAESKDVVVGYIVVEAADLDEATLLAKGCPILDLDDGSVEIRPVVRRPPMHGATVKT